MKLAMILGRYSLNFLRRESCNISYNTNFLKYMLIRNNVKSTCNWHDFERILMVFFTLCQKVRCVSLLIIHCSTWRRLLDSSKNYILSIVNYYLFRMTYCLTSRRATSKLLELVPNPFDNINKICSKQHDVGWYIVE